MILNQVISNFSIEFFLNFFKGKTVCVSPLSTTKSNLQKSNKKSGKVSFDLALDEERPTAKLQGPQTRPNQIEHSAYFGSNMKVQNINTQSFADPYIQPNSKVLLFYEKLKAYSIF